ncbi:bifunctional 5,10-methylenetetrahydrofolate dehydrogenase/5,10-methenyltetrahydrofolate cyclohydrolase [Candidatus Peregrinibacteria bacterium]|nr:bifunctional 5,10-methylenetetrahydrofolate dehydrogenase/5,10-methenyltetrahydrofolate cyclohydrolase [Candidatus Peregrinibacteria bacterium]
MATILNGREVADSVLDGVKKDVDFLKSKGVSPKLAVLIWKGNEAGKVYVKNKEKACEKVGIESVRIDLEDSVTQEELLAKIEELNTDKSVNGFIVQLPLPPQIDAPKILKAVDPYKDVDGFHAYNMGKMMLDKDFEDLAPCTPKGMIKMLDYYKIDVAGMDAVVIGKSNIVGKPMAVMLMNRGATVTVCHSKTKDVAKYAREADLVVVAVGKVGFLRADMVKKGAVVLDVGINRVDGKVVGDVDFAEVEKVAGAIAPVPGGVGPMTVACLMANTVTAAKKQNNM